MAATNLTLSYAKVIALCTLLWLMPNTYIYAQTDTTKSVQLPKKISPFLQVGKDSAELVKYNQTKARVVKKEELKAQHATINSSTSYFMGEDKYLKSKNDDHQYDSFQVYDMKGLDKKHSVVGMLTNTLERAERYDDKGEKEKKATISVGYMDKLDEKGQSIPGTKVQISAIKFKDKILVIIGEKEYRYLDGKKLVGNQHMVEQMLQGKPITELTFYYELLNAELIDKTVTFKDFSKMNLDQKKELLHN